MTKRDIKFRAFANKRKKMAKVININWFDELVHLDALGVFDFDEVELEQYTGTDDKHGVEIYDNDILRQEVLGIGYYYYVVEWYRGCFFLKGINKSSRTAMFLYFEDDYETEFEVIGNIHENPELLEV